MSKYKVLCDIEGFFEGEIIEEQRIKHFCTDYGIGFESVLDVYFEKVDKQRIPG